MQNEHSFEVFLYYLLLQLLNGLRKNVKHGEARAIKHWHFQITPLRVFYSKTIQSTVIQEQVFSERISDAMGGKTNS